MAQPFNPKAYAESTDKELPFNPKAYAESEDPKEESWGKGLLRSSLEALPAAGGLIGGVVGTPVAPPFGTVGGAGLGYGAGRALENIGKTYLLGEGPKTTEQALTEPFYAIPEGASAEMGGQVVGRVMGEALKTPIAQKGIKNVSEGLDKLSNLTAIKQAGGMLKDFRNALKKDKVSELGGTVKKVMKAGDSVETIAEKTSGLLDDTGKQIGEIYRGIDETLTNPSAKLSPKAVKAATGTPRFNPNTDVQEIKGLLKEQFGKKVGGKKVLAKMDDVLSDFSGRSDSLTDALALKGEIDGMINFSKTKSEMPLEQEALVTIRNYIRDKTNKYVESVAPSLGIKSDIAALNKQYGNAQEVLKMAEDKVARESANRMFSLTDYLAGGVGGGAIASGAGILNPATAAAAGGAAITNKLARKYGPGLISKGAESMAGGLRNLPITAETTVPFAAKAGLLGKKKRNGE